MHPVVWVGLRSFRLRSCDLCAGLPMIFTHDVPSDVRLKVRRSVYRCFWGLCDEKTEATTRQNRQRPVSGEGVLTDCDEWATEGVWHRGVCRICVCLYTASGPAGNWYQERFGELDFNALSLAGNFSLVIL